MRSSAYNAIWVNTPHLDLEQLAFAPLFGAVFPRATTSPLTLHVAAHCSAAVFVQPSNTSVEQSWVCDKAETVANLLNHMDKRGKKNTPAIAHSKKTPKNNLPPPIHTLTSHKHLIDCELSSHTKAVRNITLLFFRWPNAFWIWCFKGKDSSLFTGCKMLSITKRPWGQQRNTACEVPANTPSNQQCDPQSSYKTSSSVSPWLCVWQV